jgi:hypothetical protein
MEILPSVSLAHSRDEEDVDDRLVRAFDEIMKIRMGRTVRFAWPQGDGKFSLRIK